MEQGHPGAPGYPVRIDTERLVLREWEESDLPAILAYAADPEVVRYVTWGPNTAEQSRAFLQERMAAARVEPRLVYELAITLQATGELIGACGIRVFSAERRIADMGYVVRRDCWGSGYATECARALVRFGFERLGLHRIFATCDARNTGSAQVLQKAGMRLEGIRRKDVWQHGEWRDTMMFAILVEEYRPPQQPA
jgi:[ribosomal protein S5]-alanine N-acetyltransferase